ncbi:MAG: putative toxin-antitoxin system toxin component, PIN family [Burkholderiales bacterium RIFCSPLOWO2_02_FULL_57_36]|nr:MAG: putative toxin-antitoxin system toxin component, PIN family [Burkholderiales bacterium RIFCSPLOWO2_02_FULL_57_36]
MIPKRVVLDTNVCLDLFVFRDPRWAELHVALKDGTVEAVTRSDCRMEWLLVLNYSHLRLDDESRTRIAAEFDSLITCIAADTLDSDMRLPVCSDPDDQKFLEICRDAKADVLITKDKALLKLARKTAKAGLFLIMPPDSWTTYAVSFQAARTIR